VAGRFRLYADADVDGPLVHALRSAGWDLVRAIDLYPEGTPDPVHFARARMEGRVLVSNDRDMRVLAEAVLARQESLPGLVWWSHRLYSRKTHGQLVAAFELIAAEDEPFASCPIRILSGR